MKAYKNLVKYALAKGCLVSVFDGEEWAVKKSKKYTEIIAMIEALDEARIRIRDNKDQKVAWALIIPSLEDDETVADYSDNEFMQDWEKAYLI